tara:strand:+ start:46 stop:270 length:225 start_codon:yes stop_codon:yes gene_type:complete
VLLAGFSEAQIPPDFGYLLAFVWYTLGAHESKEMIATRIPIVVMINFFITLFFCLTCSKCIHKKVLMQIKKVTA